MPGGVRIFRAERWAEGVNTAERHGVYLAFELPAYRERRLFSEKIFCKVNRPRFIFRHVCQIKRGNPEHFARAFAVAGGDDGRMHVGKSAFLKKTVAGKSKRTSHPRHCAERIGARPQMRDLAQKFETMVFFLQGIVRRRKAVIHGPRSRATQPSASRPAIP